MAPRTRCAECVARCVTWRSMPHAAASGCAIRARHGESRGLREKRATAGMKTNRCEHEERAGQREDGQEDQALVHDGAREAAGKMSPA